MLASISALLRSAVACAAIAASLLVPAFADDPPRKPQIGTPAPKSAETAQPVNPIASSESERPSSTALTGIAAVQGLVVRSINFHGVNDASAGKLVELLDQKAGEPLDRAKIRSSLLRLYSTGRFSSLQAEAERTQDNQVSLVFVATENYFIGTITVDGLPKGGPTQNQMVNASKLALGELFTRDKLEQSLGRLTKVLQDHGYYKATVSADEKPNQDTRQMAIAFHVVPGEVVRIGDVNVIGNSGYSPAEVRAIAKLPAGKKVRDDSASRALTRLRRKYQKQGRLESQVTIVERKYDADANKLDYTFDIQRGPTVDIHVEGASIRRGLLKRYVPVFEENAVDDDLLNEGRRNLRDYFQTQGYFDVDVNYRLQRDPKDDHLHVIYVIDRGMRHTLRRVVLEGNRYFSNDIVRERMSIAPADYLMRHGRFSQSLLTRDIAAIEELYHQNGFEKVKVSSNVQDSGDRSGQLVVVLHIDEGAQTLVSGLKIVGNQSIAEQDIRDLLNTIEGQPFSTTNVAIDRDSIVNYYFNRGFPDVAFESTATPHEGDATRMNVVFTIKEGDRVFIDRVLTSGLENTRPHIVNREFAMKPGDPLSQAAMLESQRRLYDLGIFNSVNMAIQNPDGEAQHKNALFQLQEAKRYTFNYGFGVEIATGADQGSGTEPQGKTGVSPRVSFDVTRLNFRGRDQSIIFKSRVGRLQRRALLSFDEPRWFDLPKWRFTVSAFYDNTRDVNTFASERIEASTQLEQSVSKSTTMLYRFSYRRVKVDPASFPAGFTPDLIPLYSKPVRVGMPSATWIRDRRDDPIDATKGNYTTADFGLASGIFGSEANFGRLLLQNSSFYRFRKRYVIARNFRIGIESPYSDSRIVPLPERFFAGGGNSHRGFSINQAGPRDPQTGTPIGGNAMFVNNIELRLPPMTLPYLQQNLSLVLFHDMGNVFNEGRDLLHSVFQWSQKRKDQCRSLAADSTCDFNYVSHSVGTGIRYRTPIGPIRVDIGYNLNPPIFPIKQQTTTTTPHYEYLRRINFFFSIGQTF